MLDSVVLASAVEPAGEARQQRPDRELYSGSLALGNPHEQLSAGLERIHVSQDLAGSGLQLDKILGRLLVDSDDEVLVRGCDNFREFTIKKFMRSRVIPRQVVDLLRISTVEKDSELLLRQEKLEARALLHDLVNLESLPEQFVHLKTDWNVPLQARQSTIMGLHKINDHLDGNLLSFRQRIVSQA